MMCTYFDIMEDTAGYGGRTVRLSGLNRTNDNILLYKSSALYCTDVLMASPKHYKKYHCI